MSSVFAYLKFFCTWLESDPLRRASAFYALVMLAVYAGMPAEELTFDNGFIVGDDIRLRLFTAESFMQIWKFDYWWPSLVSNLFRPLTTLSFWFEYSVLGYGGSPLGYQIGNLVLHWLNVLLLFRLFRQLKASVFGAFFVALIFSIHPIATEVVANIVGRSDLLATAAVLGGMVVYFSALEVPEGRARTLRFVWVGIIAFLGVLAKESAIVLPALIAGHGLLRFKELHSGDGFRRLWILDGVTSALVVLPAFTFFIVARWIFSAGGVTDHPFIDNPLMAEGFWVSRLSALGVCGMQIVTLLFPLSLSSDYSFNAIPVAAFPFGNSTALWGWGTLALFLLLGYVAWRAFKFRDENRPWVYIAYLVAILPTSNLIIKIGSIRADRFQYLPSAFFWIGMAMFVLEYLIPRYRSSRPMRLSFLLPPIFFGAVGWLLCLGVLAHFRCYDWRSNVALWDSALAAQPNSAKVNSGAGNARVLASPGGATELLALRRHLRALEIFKECEVPIHFWPVQTYSDLLACYINIYDDANTEKQTDAEKWLDLAVTTYDEGVFVEEQVRSRWLERHGDESVKHAPFIDTLHLNYAIVLSRKGRHDDAIKMMTEFVKMMPLKSKNRNALAKAYHVAGLYKDALEEYLLVRVMEPDRVGSLEQIEQVALKIDASAKPLALGEDGDVKLNLSDSLIESTTRRVLLRYRDILMENDLDLEARRVSRVARYFYGIKDFP